MVIMMVVYDSRGRGRLGRWRRRHLFLVLGLDLNGQGGQSSDLRLVPAVERCCLAGNRGTAGYIKALGELTMGIDDSNLL